LLLVRKGDRFFAVRDVCPHAGARLSAGRLTGLACVERPDSVGSYERAGEIISCPWHGWEFDLTTGQSLVSPDRLRVATYPVKVVEGRVKVEI
ncbi:MAG: Rieske (2Fe-2S) protein, partial [Verrucomicrobiae bacterium]|nr:Rieske (2Fe-2S) protein [Verrucomicrobiae bacterium]